MVYLNKTSEEDDSGNPGTSDAHPSRHPAQVHQAQGMVMVELGVTLEKALALMEARASRHNWSLLKVARLVLAGEIMLELALDD